MWFLEQGKVRGSQKNRVEGMGGVRQGVFVLVFGVVGGVTTRFSLGLFYLLIISVYMYLIACLCI